MHDEVREQAPAEPGRLGQDEARRVLVVVGTRPEAVKLAPVVLALRRSTAWAPVLVTSGQHGSVADEVLDTFGTPADVKLATWERDGELAGLHTELVDRMARTIEVVAPATVIVQGDTATTLAGAMTAFWAGVPVVHLEAGLRSGDLTAPFPEEANRRMVAQVAALHLPPTDGAAAALMAEGVDPESIVVVGNTVVDAVRWLAGRSSGRLGRDTGSGSQRPLLLVTCHRRENWGDGTRRIAASLRAAVAERPSIEVVVAAHPNPEVRSVLDSELGGVSGVSVRDAISYEEFVALLDRARIVLTDSGGVQEEAAALGVPALVLREVTERREGVDAGLAELVGTDPDAIATGIRRLLGQPGAGREQRCSCPYGDGRASDRTVQAIGALLDGTARPEPFRWPPPTRGGPGATSSPAPALQVLASATT